MPTIDVPRFSRPRRFDGWKGCGLAWVVAGLGLASGSVFAQAGEAPARPCFDAKTFDERSAHPEAWAGSVPRTDRAVARRIDQKACIPTRCDEDVLDIDETSRDEPDAHRLKHHRLRGVGSAQVGWEDEADRTKETLQWVGLEQLGLEAVAALAEALRL